MAIPIKTQLADNIVGHWDPRTGSIADQSGNGNDGEFVTGIRWAQSVKGRCLDLNGDAGSVEVANNVAIQDVFSGGGSCSVWFNPRGSGELGFSRLLDKNPGWQLYVREEVAGTLKVEMYQYQTGTAGAWKTDPIDLNVWHHIVVTYDNSDVANDPSIYVDGVLANITEVTAPTGTPVSDSTGDLYVGNNAADNRTADGRFIEAMLIDIELSPQQASQLYTESSQEAHLNKIPEKTVLPEDFPTADTDNLLFYFNGGNFDGTGSIDLSGNGYNGTATSSGGGGAIRTVNGINGKGLFFDGGTNGSYLDMGDLAALDNASAFTFTAWVKPSSLNDFAGFFSKSPNTDQRLLCIAGGGAFRTNTEVLCFVEDGTSSNYGITTTSPLLAGALVHIAMVFDGSQSGNANRLKLYVNGEEETLSFTGTIPAQTDNNNVSVKVGWEGGGAARYFNGILDGIGCWASALTADNILDEYHKGESKLDLYTTGQDWNVSVATATSGYLENTGWQIQNGTASVSTDGDSKFMLAGANETRIYKELRNAYGTWEFTFNKPSETSFVRVMFMASVNNQDLLGANQTGYVFYANSTERFYLARMNGGSNTELFYTVPSYFAVDTNYTIRITRGTDNVFSVYVRGGAFTEWTLVDPTGGLGTNPVSSSTYATTNYWTFDLDTSDEISNILYSPVVIDPTA